MNEPRQSNYKLVNEDLPNFLGNFYGSFKGSRSFFQQVLERNNHAVEDLPRGSCVCVDSNSLKLDG